MIRYRLAGYDTTGNPLTDWDVLSADELAEDHGWVDLRARAMVLDPALVDQVARLQRRAS